MNANRKAKSSEIKLISQKIKDASSIVVAEYHGLTVAQISELRSQLREKGVELKVYKNRLVKRALKGTDYADLANDLIGPNAFAFGSEDDIAPARIMHTFAKEYEALKLKAGTFEGKVLDSDGVKEVATLPTMEEALTKLALALLTPLKDVQMGMKMLVDEGHIGGDAPAE